MAIYTKKGDKGETKVFDKKSGELVGIRKDSCKIKSIGAIDELNSFLAIVNSHFNDSNHRNKIERIQGNLFTINSILAGANLEFLKDATKKLEIEIDEMEGKLPVQTNFIFYGGTPRAASLFYARALCRRAERDLVEMEIENSKMEILKYINRLSDYLFILARNENFKAKVEEKYWKISK